MLMDQQQHKQQWQPPPQRLVKGHMGQGVSEGVGDTVTGTPSQVLEAQMRAEMSRWSAVVSNG